MESDIYRDNFGEYKTTSNSIKDQDEAPEFYKKLGLNGLSSDEGILENKMMELREEYKKRHETMLKPFPPAEPFYKHKNTIENCNLYKKVFRNMPKGGLLHVHSTAGLSVEGLIGLLKSLIDLKKVPEIRIVVQENVYQSQVAIGTMMYDFQAREKNIMEYTEPLKDYLDNISNEEWLMDLLSFRSDRIDQFPYKWDEFNTIFSRTSKLFENATFYYEYHVSFFKECIQDKIYYVELRCGFETFRTGVSTEINQQAISEWNYKNFEYKKDMGLKIEPWNCDTAEFLDKIKQAQDTVNEKHGEKEQIIVKVILCARRALDPEKELDMILKKVDTAIVLKNNSEYSNLIIGFDFVSEEDRGYSTMSYAEKIIYGPFCEGYSEKITSNPQIMDKIAELKKKISTEERIKKIDFYLHGGESNWNENYNVIDTSIISHYRVGHGFNMNKHQSCVRAIAFLNGIVNAQPRSPVLEICPISNQMLGYFPDLRNHPAYELLRQGIGCCIANDDPQLFGNPGLSYDFWEVYVGMWMNLLEIKGLVYTAYLYYYMVGKGVVKISDIMDAFIRDWNRFVIIAILELGIR